MREMTVAPEHRVGGSRGERRAGIRLAMLATFFFSTSAVLVRIAASLGPLEVASYRLIAGAGFVALIALVSGAGLGLGAHSPASAGGPPALALWLTVAAGLVAALHFALYIGSLYQTTIAHALVLVNLSPILAMPLAAVFLKERFDPRRLPGVVLVFVGLVVMVGVEPTLTRGRIMGDVMAFGAALAYAVYSLLGRSQRRATNLLAYAFRVYLVAGLVLLPLALLEAHGPAGAAAGAAAGMAGASAGVSGAGAAAADPAGLARAVVAVLLLAALPTAGGHTVYNAALRRADTVTVNLISTQEVTGGVLLGVIFLGEKPSVETLIGGGLALLGLYLALRTPTERPARNPAANREEK